MRGLSERINDGKYFMSLHEYTNVAACAVMVAGWYFIVSLVYPGLPSQLFSQPWKTHAFFHGCEKSCEGRPGYEASLSLLQFFILSAFLSSLRLSNERLRGL